MAEFKPGSGLQIPKNFLGGIPEPNPPSAVHVSSRKWEEADVRIEETNVASPSGTISMMGSPGGTTPPTVCAAS